MLLIMKKYLLLLFCLVLGLPRITVGQTTATNDRTKKYGPLHYRSLTECIGQQFICLPKPVRLQPFGYSNLRTRKGPLNGVGYNDYALQFLTLAGFEDDYAVFINIRSKKIYCRFSGDISNTKLESVAPVAEIDSARSLYLGKTLWVKQDFMYKYDPDTDRLSKMPITKWSPVTVVEVLAGFFEYEPVMFTLETEDHRRGYIACTLSGTNLTESLARSCSFNNYFSETDPRL